MPQRLTSIFNVDITSPADRHKEISSCGFQGDALLAAEEYKILPASSPISLDDELARAMESPSHVDPAIREFTAIAFNEATKRGISVQKVALTSPEQIHAFGFQKVANFNSGKSEDKYRTYLGYVTSLCSVFREATTPDGRRLFGVFSTPEPETESHVDIFVVIRPGPEEKLAIQRVFHDAFNLERLVTP